MRTNSLLLAGARTGPSPRKYSKSAPCSRLAKPFIAEPLSMGFPAAAWGGEVGATGATRTTACDLGLATVSFRPFPLPISASPQIGL